MLSCENTLPGAVRLDAAVNLEWSGTCRTCLQAGESRSIFELDQETQLTLVDKVMQCANVAIRVQDNLPDRICLQCVEELSVAYRFRTNCDSSNAVLQTYLANSLLEDKSTGLLTSDPEDGDEIAIHLDSGVMYTYKPPPGLNVRLVHRQGEDGNDNEDAIVLNSEPSIVTLDQQFENDQIFTVSSRQETQQDATDCKEEPLYESTAAEVGKIESNDAMDHLSSDRIQEDRHSTDEKTLSYMPLNNVKTLRTIRKTHAPNEVKPTIDAVTTQPAVDGIGVETVIRVKRNLNTAKPAHICTICNVTYKHKHALETHMRRHRGDRPYKCEHCDKSFVVPFELQRHVRVHTGQKPYKCKFCERAFADFGCKTKHERTHTGERPYVCEYCQKTFSYSHVLNTHLLTHTGVKRHCCTICEKRFTKSHHLKAHYKTHRTGDECVKTSGTEGNEDRAPVDDIALSEMLQGALIAANDKGEPADEESAHLLVGWTLADVTLPTPTGERTAMGISDGASGVGTSVVTIVPDELENVSIVNFGDYMMKTDALDGLMVGDSTDDDGLVTVLLPKSVGVEGTPYEHIRIIDD